MERRRNCKEQSADRPEEAAFLYDNKHMSGWADSMQHKGDPEMPSLLRCSHPLR